MNIIETKTLTFCYKKQPVLDNINLAVPEGSIYGYLGKNGAGKSTTIKLLLGLLEPPLDSIFYSGKEFSGNRELLLSKIGNLIESPSYYNNLTAYENLKYIDILRHCGEKRIKETLNLIGLKDAENKKVKHFSTGMKQRLGIGMAILHNPNLLILDEPLNGLDPEGVHDMRELLLRLNADGNTIFLSSHILSEVEKICTHAGILDKGNLVFQGEIKSLLSTVKRKIVMKINNPIKACELCKTYSFTAYIETDNSLSIEVETDNKHHQLIELFLNNGIEIYSVRPIDTDLESVFLTLTSNN